jgi:predicted transcriptional regulator
MKNTSVRIDDSTRERLDTLAAALDRSRSWLINDALKRYLDQNEWMTEAMAVREADAGGPFVLHDEVMARTEAKIRAAKNGGD